MAGYDDIYGDIYDPETAAAAFLDGNLFVSTSTFFAGTIAGPLLGNLFASTSTFFVGSLIPSTVLLPVTGVLSDANRTGTISTISPMTLTVGETYTAVITFTDVNGNLYNPDLVFLEVVSPSGILTLPTVSNPSTGVFQATFTLDERGIWRFEYQGEGPSGAIVIEGASVCAMAAVA